MRKKGRQVSKAGILRVDGRFKVSGELTFATVTEVLGQSRRLFAEAGDSIEIELGEVTRVDSAGLALLIEWMRQARTLDKAICFFDLPEQMTAIAAASDLHAILPLSPGQATPS